jgi:MoaA/NifB/PqqE/SkfB family radical SAM enzyme
MKYSKTFCPLPWIHLATRPNGDVRVCCTANASGAGEVDEKEVGLVKKDGVVMNLRDHSIEDVWNSDYMKSVRLQMLDENIPPSCEKCFEEETQGIMSKRQWETIVWKERIDIDKVVSKTQLDGTLPVDIPYFDLRLGNMCQLKCVMCSPHDSSSWIKDWKIQYPQYKTFELKQDQGWNREFDYTWYQKGSFLDTMKSQAGNIKELYFAGGEPLLIPEHYKILEFMVESGNAKDCILRYNSNGLELPDKLFDLWKNFKQVKFNFSIDSVGEQNDYIRYPSKWADVEKNLRLLDDTPDNIVINIACAVQLLNVLYLPELAIWKINSNFKKINLAPFGGGLIGLHMVYLPSYLNVKVLPIELKQLAKERIENFLTQYQADEFLAGPTGRQRWQGIINYMMSEDWTDKLKSTVEYLEVCDQTRSTDFRKVFPELKNL